MQSSFYGSSTTIGADPSLVWVGNLDDGNVLDATKSANTFVWPVRGGQ